MYDPRQLSEDDFTEAVLDLLPQGRAWDKSEDSKLRRFWSVVAREAFEAQLRANALLKESAPSEIAELLTDWERALALPDRCSPSDQGFEERRAAVVSRLTALGGASIAYFQGLATALGYEVEISERRPFICGVSRCGVDEMGPPQIVFNWIVNVLNQRLTYFRCGFSRCGEDALLAISRAAELECILERFAPAHTVPTFAYPNEI